MDIWAWIFGIGFGAVVLWVLLTSGRPGKPGRRDTGSDSGAPGWFGHGRKRGDNADPGDGGGD